MIAIRNRFLSLCLAASALFAVSCADVEGDPSEAEELGEDQQDVASTEQALNPLYTISLWQNWGLRVETAVPPRNDFRFSPYCSSTSCTVQSGHTARVTLGGGISTSILCVSANTGQRITGSYVYIYNVTSNWTCTRQY